MRGVAGPADRLACPVSCAFLFFFAHRISVYPFTESAFSRRLWGAAMHDTRAVTVIPYAKKGGWGRKLVRAWCACGRVCTREDRRGVFTEFQFVYSGVGSEAKQTRAFEGAHPCYVRAHFFTPGGLGKSFPFHSILPGGSRWGVEWRTEGFDD